MVGHCSRRELILGTGLVVYAVVFVYTLLVTDDRPQEELSLKLEVQQVHIAYGPGDKEHTSMLLSWTLPVDADECRVAYWSSDSPISLLVTPPYTRLWSNVVYREVLPRLQYDTEYTYSVACNSGMEQSGLEYRFRTNPGLKDGVSFLVLGDWATAATGDVSNPQHTLRPKPNILQPMLAETNYSGIWHLGDIAYDLFSNRGTRGDAFLRDVQPLAAQSAYMVVVGNHEIGRFFQDFMVRFPLPGQGLHWSIGIGKAQIIAFSSEFDYNRMKPTIFPKDQSLFEKLKVEQLGWLEGELKKAEEGRGERPWVVVMAHKPLYCSLNRESEMIMTVCGLQAQLMREVYEDLLLRYHVDLLLFGHVHLYERLFPLAHDQVIGTFLHNQTVFINPQAPIHIINGVAGNLENESIVMKVSATPGNWSAVMSESLGYGRLNVVNDTHLQYIQYAFGESQFDDISKPLEKRVEDEFWLVKV